jgi:hypothetical protein
MPGGPFMNYETSRAENIKQPIAETKTAVAQEAGKPM